MSTLQLILRTGHRYASDIDRVWAALALLIITLVAVAPQQGWASTAFMFRALGEAKVNINAITTSEIKICCIIDPAQADEALRAVHAAFELDKE